MVDCAARLVVEAFYRFGQVVIDAIQPHGCPQSCMPNSVERLLEVHEDMVKALLVLQIFLKQYSKIENLLSWLFFVTAVLKLLIKVSILVSWFSRARSGANFPSIVARKNSEMLGVLEFLQTEPDSDAALVFHLFGGGTLRSSLQVHDHFHYRLLEAPGLCNVHTWLEASFDHDVVNLIVVVSSWAVPCPASRWFVWTRCVRHLQVVVTGEF